MQHRNPVSNLTSTIEVTRLAFPEGSRVDIRVRTSIDLLMNADLSQQVCWRSVAARLNLSPSRFRHLFTTETGMSPQAYLTKLRMQRAEGMIKNSFLQVKEAMALVGYSDPSNFVHRYRSMFGLTPSMTREAQQLLPSSPSFE